jgi:hypothetical protein
LHQEGANAEIPGDILNTKEKSTQLSSFYGANCIGQRQQGILLILRTCHKQGKKKEENEPNIQMDQQGG